MSETEKTDLSSGEFELDEMMRLYSDKLLRYATTILCNHQDAEDVVQEVFISAYQKQTSFDGKNCSAWLYKITYHRCLNALKKRNFFRFSELKADVASNPSDEGFSEKTLQVLKRLSPKDRAVIYGRVMEEMSYDALSELMGSTPVALRKQYERAKKKLSGYLTVSNTRKELIYE